MSEAHSCDKCHEHQAEVVMKDPGGETTYLCTAPECMMAAGMCPSCNVQLEVKIMESGDTVVECSACGYRRTYSKLD